MTNSRLLAPFVMAVTTALVGGCASVEEEAVPVSPVALRGAYVAKDANGSAPIRELVFENAQRYHLRSKTCSEVKCEERGTYEVDHANHALRLLVDGSGKSYSIPFEVVTTRTEENKTASASPPPGAVATSSVKPLLVVPLPPQTEDGVQTGEGGMYTRERLLPGGPVALLVATEVKLLGETFTTGSRSHLFVVRGKQFIAPIYKETVGSLGGRVKDAAVYTLATATNAQFSEDPKDGFDSSGQFRVWESITLDVRCTESSVRLKLTDAQTKGGWEGPVQGSVDDLQTDYTVDGKWAFQAQGRPHPSADKAFQLIQTRANTTIWYKVWGRVTCDSYGDATLVFDGEQHTSFPSLRVWATQFSDGSSSSSEGLGFERAQGNFTGLWSLPTPPKF